jgi:hypothetical protein
MIPRPRKNDDSDPRHTPVAGPAGIVRRAFGHGANPEQDLERLLHERRAELEDYAARFEEAALELGHREERLRDERASIERLLRRSTVELEAREKELVEFERELHGRDERLSAGEADLARRRSDLGAVELMRAAVERREQALASREEAVTAREDRAFSTETSSVSCECAVVDLLFVPGRAYRLVQAEPEEIGPGSVIDVDGEDYSVVRIGRSPLPRDERRCAYLDRVALREPEPDGSP